MDDVAPASCSDVEGSFTVESEDSENFWKSFMGSSSVPTSEPGESYDASGLAEEQIDTATSEEVSEDESEGRHDSFPKHPKSTKRNKWKPEEVKKLIRLRGDLHGRFQVPRGRMALWEEISLSLLADGVNRTPGQCKSLWASLVQKYEGSKGDQKSKKGWPYYEQMDKILSDLQEVVKN